jgi:hypothetical protein
VRAGGGHPASTPRPRPVRDGGGRAAQRERATGRARRDLHLRDAAAPRSRRFGATASSCQRCTIALLAGTIDVAVHSTRTSRPRHPTALQIVACRHARTRRRARRPRRLTLGELPAERPSCTGSPRRAAQLRLLGLGWTSWHTWQRGYPVARRVGGRLDAVVARSGRLAASTAST